MTLSRINHTGAAASTTLNGSITGAATSLTLTSATGYPAAPFIIKVDAGTASEEKILVGVRSGTGCSSLTRGYDGTTQTSHSSGAAVEHDLGANVVDDLNDHVYTTSRDDHTQYLRVDGTRAGTGTQTLNALTVTNGVAVTGAVTGSSTVQGTALAATLAGAGRYVGGTNGAPSSGTYITGDFATDPTNGTFWVCTAGGTPGTWVGGSGGATDAAWTPATLLNSWVAAGGGTFTPGYRKVNGRVYLRGEVKSGSVGTTVFTLPAGYRPSATLYPPGSCSVSPAPLWKIDTAGNVSVNIGSNTEAGLDGVSFDTL